MSNIHPCPFCKSDDVAVFGRLWGGEINDGIRCASCGAEADIYLWDELANHIHELEAQLARLVEAAKKVRHWHDTHDGGMVVSGESVRGLWEATKEATGEGK